MSENTKIEWADHTWNPWEGCQKVGPGCDNCYAENRNARFAGGVAVNWGPGAPRRRTSPANWRKPLQWDAQADAFQAQHGRRQRVFCSSLADVFDNEVDPQWRVDLFRLIEATPNLDWLLLTKRIGNAAEMMFVARGGHLPLLPNVWIGATIVNQAEADRDIPKLLATPAAKRFLSMEPLLGAVDIRQFMWPVHPRWPAKYRSPAEAIGDGAEVTYHRQGLVGAWVTFVDWVIVGGESGPGARPMHPDWARSLRDQCTAAGVPFLFKQWGEWTPGENVQRQRGTIDTAFLVGGQWHIHPLNLATDGGHIDDEPDLYRVGKKAAGRLLDGIEHNSFPQSA